MALTGFDGQDEKPHRVQIDFSGKGYKDLQAIKALSGLPSVSALIRNALGLYRWWLEVKASKSEILTRDPQGNLTKMKFIVFES